MATPADIGTSIVQDIISRWKKMTTNRTNYESQWQDIANYTLPSRDFFHQYAAGTKRNTKIFDITGIYANEQLAGWIHGSSGSSQSEWFALGIEGKKAPGRSLQIWLDNAKNTMHDIFNNVGGGFSTQLHEYYLELVAFGNGIFYEEIVDGRIVFRCFPLADCYFSENAWGVVDTMYRRTRWTAKAAMQYFGDKASDYIKEKFASDPNHILEIIHCVEPRIGNTIVGGYKTNKPWGSYYIDVKGQTLLDEGGYDMFPYQVGRWSKRSGEEAGFGPGGAALPSVKMVNRMMEVSIRGIEKLVDPPLLVPDDGVIQNITLQPGGINIYRAGSDKIEPLVTNTRPEIAIQAIEGVQSSIMRQYYVDWLQIRQGQPLTATETIDNRDKSMRLMAPIIARDESEFRGPLIKRVLYLAMQIGLIPPPPDEIAGQKIRVKYISQMAQAQRMGEMDSIVRTIQFGNLLSAYDPLIGTNINTDNTYRYVAQKINHVPEELLNSMDDVSAMRNNAAQAQQQQQRNEQALAVTKSIQQGGAGAQAVAAANATAAQ